MATAFLRAACVLLLHTALSQFIPADGADNIHPSSTTWAADPLICFVVRTYFGHGAKYGDSSLSTLLTGLQNQQNKSRCDPTQTMKLQPVGKSSQVTNLLVVFFQMGGPAAGIG